MKIKGALTRFFGFFFLPVLGIQAACVGFTFSSVRDWYPALHKPLFNPPSWIFGPVWTVLYFMIALSGWRYYEKRLPRESGWPLFFYAAQLALNLVWSYLFFFLRRPDLALVCILLLDLAVWKTILSFRHTDTVSAGMLLPYGVWILFASYLNLGVYLLNR